MSAQPIGEKSKKIRGFSKQKTRVVSKKKLFPYVRPPARELNLYLLFGIILFILGFALFLFQGESNWTWVLWIVGIVVSFNAFWLRFDFATPFVWKYGITMLKTKHFIKFIESLLHVAWWFEKVCLVGMFLGFGLVGVDYWFYQKTGKKLGWKKRLLTLLISGILLGLFFKIFLGDSFFLIIPKGLFAVPVLAPLYLPSLICFIFLGFGGMSLAILLGYGFLSVIALFTAKQLCPAVAPVIPGAPIPGLGVAIPLIGWISLVVVLVVHEFSHGVMMAYYKEKIKSVGVLLAGIIPLGAFVEQDDKTFDTLDDDKSLMVLSAGSASNLLTIPVAFVILLVFSFAVSPFVSGINAEFDKAYSGVSINKVEDTVSFCGITAVAPAKGKFLVGDKILAVNGVDVNSIVGVNTEFLRAQGDVNFTIERKVCMYPNCGGNENCVGGQSICETNDLNLSVTPFKFEDVGIKKIGVDFEAIPTGYQPPLENLIASVFVSNISLILLLLVIISFAAGSFNYFPSDPFDGGRMAKIMLVPYFAFLGLNKKETQKFIGRLFVWLLLASLILNMIPYATMLF